MSNAEETNVDDSAATHCYPVVYRSHICFLSDVSKAAEQVDVWADAYEDRSKCLLNVAQKLTEMAEEINADKK